MKWLLLVSLALAGDPTIEQRVTTLDDLDQLARQKAWSEMVFRMKEVPAADRKGRWEELVEQAAIGHLDTLALEAGSDLDSSATALLDEFPSLRRSPKFMVRRTEVSLTSLRKCYDNPFVDDECGGRLYDLARRDSKDGELVRRAAAIVLEKESATAALPFLKLVMTPSNRSLVCREELWQKVVLGALGSAEGTSRRLAREIAGQDCWSVFKEKLSSELERKPDSVTGICEVLKERNRMTPAQEKKCSSLQHKGNAQGPASGG